MKLQHFILAGFLGFVFSSCDLSGRMESTPRFGFQAMHIVNGDTTVLNFHHVPDTILVGDTIHFQTWLDGGFHGLTEFRITPSQRRSVEFIWLPKDSLDLHFTNASDYERGIFMMDGTFWGLHFPFQYVALEADEDLILSFTVQNAGSRNYNTTTVSIRTPIKEAKTEDDEELY